MVLLFACIVPVVASRSLASGIDYTGRIAAGREFTCAIKTDDTVWCWGSNGQYQLGSSSYVGMTESLVPVQVASFGNGRIATKIVAGNEHVCILANDGTVWCWGRERLWTGGIFLW